MSSHALPMASFPVDTRMLSNTIPLHCNICPKKPNFSDVSHLLTHIASKGHLSTYYKIKVKAGNEDASRRLIEHYDTWYATWNIESLMSERMNLKEEKRRPRRAINAVNPVQSSRNGTAVAEQGPYMPENSVDPRLGSISVKSEPFSRGSTPFVNPISLQNPFMYQPQPWYRIPYPFNGMPMKQEDADCDEDEEDPSSAYSPTPSRIDWLLRRQGSTSAMTGDDVEIDDGLGNDSTKLKGVFWPGMNMFDAATPDMKRKRNQKKATSVVEQLEALSKDIDATELVFSPSGILRKARHISGFPNSDSSPLKGEESPPKKRAPRRAQRVPLAEKDVNAPLGGRAKRKPPTRSTLNTRINRGDEEDADEAVEAPPKARGKRGRPAKKRRLQVHRDQEDSPLDENSDADDGTASYDLTTIVSNDRPASAGPTMNYRSATPLCYGYQGYNTFHGDYGINVNSNPNVLDQPFVPAWDFLGQDLGGSLDNPLFIGDMTHGLADDDDQTISAPLSEN